MKNLDIKYVSAQNFLCFGPDGFELDLSDYGNIVLVKGLNLDTSEGEKAASNGVGKSSIPEIIVYTLFGKTIKHPKKVNHKDVVNNQTGKGLRTEVRWGDFRAVRTRKPDSLRLWESSEGKWDDNTEISLGGQPATQKLLEEKLGLNYETFVNVVVFTDNNSGSFLECDAASKREIVENLLSLDKYKSFGERAKNLRKDKKDAIRLVQQQYESLRQEVESAKSRLSLAENQESKWKEQRKEQLKSLEDRLDDLREKMKSSSPEYDTSEYESAQKNIAEINEEIPELEKKQVKIQEVLDIAQEKSESSRRKLNELQISISTSSAATKSLSTQISEHEKEISRLEKSTGATCKYCMGTVSKDNYSKYTDQLLQKISEINKVREEEDEKRSKLESKVKELNGVLEKISSGISSAKENAARVSRELSEKRRKLTELNRIQRPQSDDVKNKLMEQQIEGLREQVALKKSELEGDTPFVNMIKSLRSEINAKSDEFESKNSELDALEKELPYYEFWTTAFGDAGIRKFVVEGIIPALNSKVAYWLQFLIDGRIRLEFDNELEETIQRNPSDGDPFVYYAMSGGERRRLNLAVSQAFAHVMMISSGTCPNLVFLDEVTTNIDQIGVVGVYNMILELAKERQVFITTHDQNLLEMLEGCELIKLEKKKGFTTLKK